MRPWSMEVVRWGLTDQEHLVEYACHEGNVGLAFTLSGARAKESEQQAEENGDRLAFVTGASREAGSNPAPRPAPELCAVIHRADHPRLKLVMGPAAELDKGCIADARPNEGSNYQ